MTRQTKTPRQRAEEALALAERKHKKALRTYSQLQKDCAAAASDLEVARDLHDYAKQHPALQAPSTTTPPKEEGKA